MPTPVPTAVDLSAVRHLFTQRRLAEALARLDELPPAAADPVERELLRGQIYLTNGRYQADPTFFQRALRAFAAALAAGPAAAVAARIELYTGRVRLQLEDWPAAAAVFDTAARYALPALDVELFCARSELARTRGRHEQAHELARAAERLLSERPATPFAEAQVYWQLAKALLRLRRYGPSLEYSQRLLSHARQVGLPESEALALGNIAVVCGGRSNYKMAMQYFLEALEGAQAIGFRYQVSQVLINIATIYAHLFNYDEAVDRYQTVLRDYRDVLSSRTQAIVFNNLGNIYYTLGRPDSTQTYFERALELAVAQELTELIPLAHAQLGRAALARREYDRARTHTRLATGRYAATAARNGRQINQLNRAELLRIDADYPAARTAAAAAVETARALHDDANELRGYQLLSQIYRAEENYERALVYQERYAERRDEFVQLQRNRQFVDLEIREAIAEKQREIEQLTRENEVQAMLLSQSDRINTQNEELRRINEELRQFAYVVSHDLKEPLRMIGRFTELIRRAVQPAADAPATPYFDYVSEGVERMNQLLDALLRYATTGRGETDTTPVDLGVLWTTCVRQSEERIEQLGAMVTHDPLPVVRGARPLLLQVFQNLLVNALKFHRPDAAPQIHLAYHRAEGRHHFALSDNGIGIDPDDAERIFVIFQRLHARERYAGTGIGLALCRKILRRFGGDIRVEPRPDGPGSVFRFWLPLHEVVKAR